MSIINAIPCGTNTSDATAAKTEIISGKTAYVKGQKLTGTLERVNALWRQCIADTGNGAINAGDFVSSINTKLNREIEETINDMNAMNISSCLIDTNTILICYTANWSNGYTGYAVVAYISADRISYGKPYEFATKVRDFCCCTIHSELVFVAYIRGDGCGVCKTLEISGNTVLLNNEKIINAGSTGYISCCSIAESSIYKIAITYVDNTISEAPANLTIVDTFAGNVTLLYSSGIGTLRGKSIDDLKCCNVNENTISISYIKANIPAVIVGSIGYVSSAITVDYGSPIVFPLEWEYCTSLYCSKIINNKLLITYLDGTEDLKMVYLDINGINDLSFKYENVSIPGIGAARSCVLNSNNIIIACDTGFGSFGRLITISNNNIIVTDSEIKEYGQIYVTDCVRVNDSTGIMLFSVEPSMILITSTVSNTVRKYVSGQSYPLFGVSRDSSNDSAKINVYTV